MAIGGPSIVWTGLTAFQAYLAQAGARASHALGTALYGEAVRIFAESQRLCPVDTGTLRGSGHVTTPHKEGMFGVTVEIGYGGPAASYALYVHEITTAAHAPPTQAKFLEQPLLEGIPGMLERMRVEIARELAI